MPMLVMSHDMPTFHPFDVDAHSHGSVLIRELPLEYVARPPGWPRHHPCHDSASTTTENTLIHVEAGSVTLGKPNQFPRYASVMNHIYFIAFNLNGWVMADGP